MQRIKIKRFRALLPQYRKKKTLSVPVIKTKSRNVRCALKFLLSAFLSSLLIYERKIMGNNFQGDEAYVKLITHIWTHH